MVALRVADPGSGLAPEDRGRIFQEFTQFDGVMQMRVNGTGLGLPLRSTLTELLVGSVSLESEPGLGSTFTAVVPLIYGPRVAPAVSTVDLDPGRAPIRGVEDVPETILIYEKFVAGAGFQVVPARTLREARDLL